MAYSKQLLCNMALAHTGSAGRISDIDLDNSAEARNCRLFFDHCVENLLAMQRWAFASQEVQLALIDNAGAAWDYRYKYPNFAARCNFIVDANLRVPREDQKIPYRITNIKSSDGYGKAIDTDEANAVMDINLLIEDASLFTPSFAHCLSLMLALNISTPLRIDPTIRKEIGASFTYWLAEAGSQNLAEETNDESPDSEFQTVRN